ncbi:hypothetical protein NDU88_007265 [Pleurodeles waltl]|uniref:Uncharacterized protein n=1 Tax=Pleurodeles waltl TaxID=8319 RepID=A0AAV7U0R8_PLEWA|nr:hypothetical protein NDU88_007265 [Pleurodeles waltl]
MDGREAEYLQAVVALLEKAGRMDLLRQEALPALCPARKAAHGVAAAVMACSPPRSGGRASQRRLAADTPGKRCGGRGRAPAGAPASWEWRPGPAGVQVGVRKKSAVETAMVEGPRRAQEVWDHGIDPWCVDNVLDYDETSLEEGELVDDGTEESWWEQGRVGPANALSQSLQATRDQTRPRVRVSEEGHSGRRKAQERPPSLPAGEEASVTMVSVVVEASEPKGLGAMRLLKGIYVADAGWARKGSRRKSR